MSFLPHHDHFAFSVSITEQQTVSIQVSSYNLVLKDSMTSQITAEEAA